MTAPKKPRPFDYVEAIWRADADGRPEFKRILRRLVREAVRECEQRTEWDDLHKGSAADRIARELIP